MPNLEDMIAPDTTLREKIALLEAEVRRLQPDALLGSSIRRLPDGCTLGPSHLGKRWHLHFPTYAHHGETPEEVLRHTEE